MRLAAEGILCNTRYSGRSTALRARPSLVRQSSQCSIDTHCAAELKPIDRVQRSARRHAQCSTQRCGAARPTVATPAGYSASQSVHRPVAVCFGTHGLTRQNFSKWRYSRCSSPTVNGVYASNSLHTKLPPAQSTQSVLTHAYVTGGLRASMVRCGAVRTLRSTLRALPPECTKECLRHNCCPTCAPCCSQSGAEPRSEICCKRSEQSMRRE